MTLATARAAASHVGVARIYLDNVLLYEGAVGTGQDVLSVTVERGFDTPIASAEVVFADDITGLLFGWRRQEVGIDLGWLASGDGPFYKRVLTGVALQRGQEPDPLTKVLSATSRLELSQDNLDTALTFENQTGKQIHEAVLTACAISSYSIDDEPDGAVTLGTEEPITLSTDESPLEFLDRLNEAFGMALFDDRSGYPRRRRVLGQPAANARASLSKSGPDFFTVHRREDISAIYSKVIVQGRPKEDGDTVAAGSENTTALVVRPKPFILSCEMLQTVDQCQASADILIQDVSHVQEEITYTVVGDPESEPGDTDGYTWDDLGWTTEARYFVKRVRHQMDDAGFITDKTAVGGVGSGSNFSVLVQPNAGFTMVVTIDEDEDSVTVECTDTSTDPDGTIAAWDWSNDHTADVSSTNTYTFEFALSTAPDTVCVDLSVTDNDGLQDSAERCIHLDELGGGSDGTPPPISGGSGGDGGAGIPVPAQTVMSAAGQGKMLFIGSAAPPAGWTQNGYDDSAWIGAVDVSHFFADPPWASILGAQWISYQDTTPNPNGDFIHRRQFSVPAGRVTSATIELNVDDRVGVWLNGLIVYQGNSLTSVTQGGSIAFALIPGATNQLAIQVHNTGGGGHAVTYAIRINV